MSWRKHKLQLVKESAAQGRIAEIFADIKETLGIPYVNIMFQALASYPEFFDVFWRTAKPALQTQEFFSFADRLGAEAYTRMHNYFPVPDLQRKVAEMDFSLGAQHELFQSVELFHYNAPLLLLTSAALQQSFENPTTTRRPGTLPANHPVFTTRPILVDEEHAPPVTRKIYEDIRRTLGTPFLNLCYLNFGRWPDFLKAYWDCLKPLLKTPLYEQHRLALRESALAFANDLPEPFQLSTAQMEEAGVPEDDVTAIVHLTDLYLNLQSKQVLNVAFAKIGLEDGVRTTQAA